MFLPNNKGAYFIRSNNLKQIELTNIVMAMAMIPKRNNNRGAESLPKNSSFFFETDW